MSPAGSSRIYLIIFLGLRFQEFLALSFKAILNFYHVYSFKPFRNLFLPDI